MPNITGATKYFTKAAENTATMTLASSIAAGATTVPITGSNTNYADGDVIAFVIEPTSATNKQVFTGTMLGGSATNVVWTYGTNVPHTAGVAIVDYVTATDWDLLSTGIQKHANQDGTLKTAAVQAALNTSQTSSPDWTILGATASVTASNGQKEYQITFTGANYTDRLQPGTKLQIPRSAAPPTQSMAFVAASSQYASKASPAGMTFTTAFTCEAWVYLNSYTSSGGTIIRRDSGTGGSTGGWLFDITPQGQLRAGYFNASGAYSLFNTYQSIPLNTWVHVAAVVGSVNPISGAIYANGVSLPTTVSVSNATSMVNAGTLAVGADLGTSGGANNFLDGYISEARVWSVAQTQAQVQANMGISLTGSETNLVALFQGNGNFNDKTSNANNLTASGGAVATQVANPYSTNEYAIITALSYTGGNTVATVFSGPCVVPNAALGTVSYSSARAPFGFPAQRAKWRVAAYFFGDTGSIAVGSFNSQIDSGYRLTVPSGEWEMGWKFVIITTGSTSSTMNTKPNIVPVGASISSANVVSIERYTSGGAAVTELESNFAGVNRSLSLTSQSTYGLYNTVETAGGTVTWRIPNSAIGTEISRFYAECAYI